jgi:hypothetical protein
MEACTITCHVSMVRPENMLEDVGETGTSIEVTSSRTALRKGCGASCVGCVLYVQSYPGQNTKSRGDLRSQNPQPFLSLARTELSVG